MDDLHKGSYGICAQCRRDIEPARLERLVQTNLCSSCIRN
ncbi:MAG: hypothetical protein GX133_01405 [Syntrophomonadaceae bacterium]|nr:hypothetical protein [Syntrophomonadaceae bacterium]